MSEQSTIRRASHDECALLTGLACRSKASWGYSDQFMADCIGELTIDEADMETQQFFVLESAGALIGFYALQAGGDGAGELVDLFVEPARLHEGHGRRLLEHAKDTARALGWRRLRVESDPHASGFYCSCGGLQIGSVASGSIPGRRLPLIEIPV